LINFSETFIHKYYNHSFLKSQAKLTPACPYFSMAPEYQRKIFRNFFEFLKTPKFPESSKVSLAKYTLPTNLDEVR